MAINYNVASLIICFNWLFKVYNEYSQQNQVESILLLGRFITCLYSEWWEMTRLNKFDVGTWLLHFWISLCFYLSSLIYIRRNTPAETQIKCHGWYIVLKVMSWIQINRNHRNIISFVICSNLPIFILLSILPPQIVVCFLFWQPSREQFNYFQIFLQLESIKCKKMIYRHSTK